MSTLNGIASYFSVWEVQLQLLKHEATYFKTIFIYLFFIYFFLNFILFLNFT